MSLKGQHIVVTRGSYNVLDDSSVFRVYNNDNNGK